MDYTTIFLSLFIGTIAGSLYGCVFYWNQLKKTLKNKENFHRRGGSFLYFIQTSGMRLCLLLPFLYYVLRTNSLDIILVFASFLGAFWITLMYKKVCQNGRH